MKAEHRKELQTNELADWLGRTLESVKTNNRSWKVGGGIVLGVALLIAVYAYFLSASSSGSSIWGKLNSATDLKDLERLAEENKNLVGRTARFEMARMLYNEGVRDLSNPDVRASAIAKLERARQLYEELAAACKDAPLLAQEAMMWTARAEEALIGAVNPDKPGEPVGSIDRAIAYYRKLAEATPESFQTQAAAERAKQLEAKKAQIQAFYAKLHENAGKLKK